jgi:hypothetical protein
MTKREATQACRNRAISRERRVTAALFILSTARGAAIFRLSNNQGRVVVDFRFVCPQHRQRFIDSVELEGCRDPAAMEQVRRLLLAWLSERYPRLVLDSYNTESCIGCALHAACIDLSDMHAMVREASRRAGARTIAGDSGAAA